MRNIRCEVLIASAILLLVISVPFLQVQMVAAKKHHSDEESSDVSSSDQSSSDQSSSDQSSSDQSSSDQSSSPSLTDKICHALNSGAGVTLIPLLHAAGIATGGTLNTAILAAQGYCAVRGG
jgi:cytoskeletal protein RodZ